MKPVKRFTAFALALLMLAGLTQLIFAAPKVGDAIGDVLYTDIVTYINGFPIRSYNIRGNTAVVVEELSNYGFYVVWYGVERKLTVIRSEGTPIVGGFTPEKNTHPIGSKAMPVFFTDIVTYLDGEKVDSCNVGGRTIIYVDDLAKFYAKEYVWDPKARTLSLTLRGASAPTPDENNPVPSGEPVIESQPENCIVKEGDYAVFEVRASGEDLKYIWQRDESDFNPAMPDSSVLSESSWNWVDIKDGRGISGANSSKLTVLADLYAIKSGSYRCIITDKNGNSVTSDYASIIPITPGIKITAQPQDQVEKAGLFATLHVGAEGLDLKYQWQELVAEYKTDGEFGMTFEYRNVKDGNKYAGAKTNTLTLVVNPPPPVGIVPEGKMQKFICLITDRYGMTISSYPAEIKAYTEIRITEQPKNIVMTERIPAELTVKAEGDPQITYRWQFLWIGTWTDLPDDHPLKFSGVDTQTLTWNQTSGTMKFRCVISSPHSEPVISDEVSITYNLPPEDYQIRHPKNIRAKFFEDAYFDFDFIGLKVDSLDCTWQKKGRDGIWVDIPDSNSKKLEVYVCQETSGCWFRCTGVVNGHAFTTVSARLEGTLVYRRQNLTQRTITIKENGALHWIDINDYIIGEGLTYEWHGHRNRMPENLYIIEPEYTVYKYGSVVHVVRTEVYGSKLGISTTGRRGAFTRHTGGSGWLQGRDEIRIYVLDLYEDAECTVTDIYGEKLTFHFTFEYEYVDNP